MTVVINGSSGVNLDFSTGGRITGDFSNSTVANRAIFQSSTTNGQTGIQAIPNGTSQQALFEANSDSSGGTNGSVGQFGVVTGSEIRVISGQRGAGTYLPMTFYTGGVERARIGASGGIKWLQQNEGAFAAGEWSRNASWGTYYKAPASGTTADIALVSANGTVGWKVSDNGAGYTLNIGSGGTVTQATSKATAVTLNKPSGRVTTNNGALAANTAVAFIVNNSIVAVTDNVICNCVGGTGDVNAYIATAFPFAGGFYISLRNLSAGSLSEAIQIQFSVVKGAVS